MVITIDLPDTIDWKPIIRDFRLMVAMKEAEFSNPNNIERLGVLVIQALLKEGILNNIGKNEKPQRKRK